MVLELFRRPLGSDPSALVQRFVEDAFSVESATVVAGWDTRTLFQTTTVSIFPQRRELET